MGNVGAKGAALRAQDRRAARALRYRSKVSALREQGQESRDAGVAMGRQEIRRHDRQPREEGATRGPPTCTPTHSNRGTPEGRTWENAGPDAENRVFSWQQALLTPTPRGVFAPRLSQQTELLLVNGNEARPDLAFGHRQRHVHFRAPVT